MLEDASRSGREGAFDFIVGLAYEQGRGRPHDPERAREHYRNGALLGDANAKQALTRLASADG
ncbi:MAG: SEL1-like repeat protein [Planctomycetota bacterium]